MGIETTRPARQRQAPRGALVACAWRAALFLASCVALSLLLCAAALSQTAEGRRGPASLVVRVTDANDNVIITATVKLRDAGGRARTAQTDAQGLATFAGVVPGDYLLDAQATGFEPLAGGEVTVKAGNNSVTVQLDVAKVKEELTVRQSRREEMTDPRGRAFTNVLTADQIAQLPDDPDEFEAAIREMAGPGAVIRVNGFTGGRLPPKSQIREIRFRLNPYAAENHEAGLIGVDIYTKPGAETWHGTLNLGFRDESLAARNAFATRRGAEQYRRLGLTLDGPLVAKRTSLFLSAEGLLSFDSKTIFAALPGGIFSALARAPSRSLNLSVRAEHALTKYHTLRLEYQRNALLHDDLGVGNFDLPERAFSDQFAEHLLRVSDSGPLGKRLVNELRFQARLEERDALSASDSPAVIVLNAFNAGGAQARRSSRTREAEFADNVDFAEGKHAMKAGLLVKYAAYRIEDRSNSNGTFTFSNLGDFIAARPVTFTRREGDPRASFSLAEFGGFWQDDYRLREGLSLSYGVRYEGQSNLGDRDNFAPRVGLAWSPFKSGHTTVRAGAGFFYDWLDALTYGQTLLLDGTRQHDIVVRSPGFPDPFRGGSLLVLPPSLTRLAADLRLPYVTQVSANVEHLVAGRFTLRAGYMRQRGAHLLRGHNVNAPVAGSGRPDPSVGNITQVESSANSWFDQLHVSLGPSATKLSGRLFWIVNYSWSKATDEADSALSLPADNFDLAAERGPSATDVRHRLFAVVNLRLFDQLRLGTTFRTTSAPPYNITTGRDDNGDTMVNDRPAGVGRNSARAAAQWDLSARLSWTLSFGKLKDERAGPSVARARGDADTLSALSGGGGGRWRMQFYVQAYNLFNHVNRINFTGVQTSPFFGTATVALPGRRIETGVRFSF
jgi:hypothetical protein